MVYYSRDPLWHHILPLLKSTGQPHGDLNMLNYDIFVPIQYVKFDGQHLMESQKQKILSRGQHLLESQKVILYLYFTQITPPVRYNQNRGYHYST